MATLNFDGTDDYVGGTAPGGLSGAFTLAALIKRDTTAASQAVVSTQTTGPAAGFSFFMNAHGTEPRPEIYNDNAGGQTSPPVTGWGGLSTDLLIVALTRGTGETPRFHAKNVTTSGAWKHNDGEAAQLTNPDAATLSIEVGRFGFPGVGNFDFFDGSIGLVGWWDGVEMSDGQVEALSTTLKTSEWYGHAVGLPTSLTEMNTATPADIKGLVTWTVNGPALTGDNMTAWTFDGGGVPIAPSLYVTRSNRRFL
jgi:hypothetical protein